jgi:phage tail sheath protein FI
MSQRKSTKKKQARSYLSPGVYVEEVSSGSRPIEGVGTAVAAFVGFARRQPVRAALAAAAVLAVVGAVVRALRR